MERLRYWRLNFALVPALGVAALPKCPICLMALLSSVGLGGLIEVRWLLPLMFILLGAAVGILAFRARSRRGLGPFYVGLLAAFILLLSKFYFDNQPSMYVGAALLIGASVWNSLPKRRPRAGQSDCRC